MKFERLGIVSFLLFSSCRVGVNPETQVSIAAHTDLLKVLEEAKIPFEALETHQGMSLFRVSEDSLTQISSLQHKKSGVCAGFSLEAEGLPLKTLLSFPPPKPAMFFVEGSDQVKSTISNVEEQQIRASIEKLSSFQNRYYKSPHGQESQNWVKSKWKTYADEAWPDHSINLFQHSRFPQPSVILTIPGKTKPEEFVIIGAHGDSISGWSRSPDMDAPGADDNASGVSTVTEILRVLSQAKFSPERSLVFVSYAAEEVGLLGSQDVAKSYKDNRKNVVGVMQLDMTNMKSSEEDLVFIRDYTDDKLTLFTKKLAEIYLPEAKVRDDRCNYGCSDHVSWTRNGFRSVFPFESRVPDLNPNIHSSQDTLSRSGDASHAVSFAKLGVAFAMELSKEGSVLEL